MHTYNYITIPDISPLEIFTNSIINDCASIYILGHCSNINIELQAKIILNIVIATITSQKIEDTKIIPKEEEKINVKQKSKGPFSEPKHLGKTRPFITNIKKPYLSFGGKITTKDVESIKTSNTPINELINFNNSIWVSYPLLLQNYLGNTDTNYKINDRDKANNYYNQFNSIFDLISVQTMQQIAGKQTVNCKKKIIDNAYRSITVRTRPTQLNKVITQLVDTINDLIFEKTLNVYKDMYNKNQPKSSSSGSYEKLSGEQRNTVRQISRLIAKKVLETTDINIISNESNESKKDLLLQIDILQNVSEGNKMTIVDDDLYEYFNKTYRNQNNFVSKDKNKVDSESFIEKIVKNKNRNDTRVINNAIPAKFKEYIENVVVCPTSSVCDSMKNFGSCVDYKKNNNQEFYNMDFFISGPSEQFFYYGSTKIKGGKRNYQNVSINYGFSYNKLQIYVSDLIIDLSETPIVLQANYTFKTVVNKIVEIWRTNPQNSIEELWKMLEGNDYFLSILKLGSQKAVGDIFQEINSTLANGGYDQSNEPIQGKTTYGLANDRPSGIRMLKLLKDSASENYILPKTTSGYFALDTYLLYQHGQGQETQQTKQVKNKQGTKRGGKKTKKIKKYKKKYKTKKHKSNGTSKTKKIKRKK
jgi:hypothetical protein